MGEQIIIPEIENRPGLQHYRLLDLPLLDSLKERYQQTGTAVCAERAKLITDYIKQAETSGEPAILTRAKAISHYLSNREPVFHNDNLIAGSTTSKEVGAPVYPELLGLSIWPELETISDRENNKQQLTPEEVEILNFDVYPYWMDKTLLEKTRKKLEDEESPTLEALELMERVAFFITSKASVISHTTPYYHDALSRGLEAIIAEAKQHEEAHPDKAPFYQAMQISMQGIVNYAKKLSRKASELAQMAGTRQDKERFETLAAICAHVPAKPARTFHEAVNSLWLCHVGVLAENVNMALNPGRLDQILFPYFKKDVENNQITIPEAMNLIGCLWLKISDNTNLVPESAEKMFGGAGSVPAVTLGGVDMNGEDATNDLTYLMLRVTELLCVKDPNVNARYYPGVNSERYRDRVVQVIMNTKAIPALYNDRNNIDTLVNQGVSLEHARDYAIIGCVELASGGREFSSSSSILLNLSAAMDMTLFNGKRPYIMGNRQIGPRTGDPGDLDTFEKFQKAFETQLEHLATIAMDLNEELGLMHQKMLPSPLLSCFFAGPMDKGRDLVYGGALYNSSGITHIAFADVCDSLNAVDTAVYRDKVATLGEMKEAVQKNFAGYERLHTYLIHKAPKYGMDDDGPGSVAVKNSRRLIQFLYRLYQNRVNYRGGRYRPAFWTMTNHAGLGKIGQALPSGRKAGEVFSSGITPSSQAAKNVTGAYHSVAILDSRNIPGGYALNMKYTPEPATADKDRYLDKFAALVEGYFKQGGMQVQYNIQSYEDLMDAMEHPERHPHLIVRVSGYSAYFKDLNPAMKWELITRTQYDLDSGGAVPFQANHRGGNQ
jgi:formate C-acetyltransferase